MKTTYLIKVIIAVFVIVSLLVGLVAIINHFTNSAFSLLEPPEFGGENLFTWDFSKPLNFSNSSGTTYYADNVKMVSKGLRYDFSNERFNLISDNVYNGTALEPFVIFGYNSNTRVSDFSYYTIDVDFSIPKTTNKFAITPDFRNDSYELKSVYCGLVLINGQLFNSQNQLLCDVDTDFHLTYIISITGEALIYINGQYVTTYTGVFAKDATNCDGVKFAATIENSDILSFGFDNVEINTFKLGYKGAISKLYNSHDDLNKCPDSILFER